MNLYNVYFTSKGTGPRTVQIDALNQSGAKAQVGLVPWRLQHYIEPAAILSEEEIRLVVHAIGKRLIGWRRLSKADNDELTFAHFRILLGTS